MLPTIYHQLKKKPEKGILLTRELAHQIIHMLCSPIEMHPLGTSGQDRGIGRHTLPPHTTKKRTTTHLKTKNNQNCQKIVLYGSLTTKR